MARLSTAPAPVITPQPMRQAEVSGTVSSIFTTWRELTTVYSANAELAANWYAGSPLTVKGWFSWPKLPRHQVGLPVSQAEHEPQ